MTSQLFLVGGCSRVFVMSEKATVVPAVSDDRSAFGQDGVFAELKSAVEKGPEQSRTLFIQLDQGAVVRKEVRDDKKNRDGGVQSDHFQAV